MPPGGPPAPPPPHEGAGLPLPLARRRTLSERLFPAQEGLAPPTSPREPEPEPTSPQRTRSTVRRLRTSMSQGSEHAVADSPADGFPPAAALEPGHSSDGIGGERASPVRRRVSLSDRLFRRSTSQEDAPLDAEGRPRARRTSLSEKFIEAQSNEGIPVPSPPSPSPAETPPDSQDTVTGNEDGNRQPQPQPQPHRPESPTPSEAIEPPSARVKSYHPLALEVLVLLMPGSVLGVLARLGLSALDTYDGQGVFALAWVQGIGCLVMGCCVGWRDQISALSVSISPCPRPARG
ncbi:hypothetical protein CALCODRAFT_178069 [Calocera cornea HHB12733]|uniref:Uncharacterized protein n=1 Tax=Calocera cornea HHB12733 TaxID=1353952 RepID=A0A165CEA6_9BASI|nr:hypothetical protein CALCODRAFT_178069 [Calocera cornea HHB12733]